MITIAICILIARIVITYACIATGSKHLLIEKTGVSYIILGLSAAINKFWKNKELEAFLSISFPEYFATTLIYNSITKLWN